MLGASESMRDDLNGIGGEKASDRVGNETFAGDCVCFALFSFVSRSFGSCFLKSSRSLQELYWSTCTPWR